MAGCEQDLEHNAGYYRAARAHVNTTVWLTIRILAYAVQRLSSEGILRTLRYVMAPCVIQGFCDSQLRMGSLHIFQRESLAGLFVCLLVTPNCLYGEGLQCRYVN